MNILIYIPLLTQEYGGVRQYATGLITTLAADKDNSYFIYHNSKDPEVLQLLNTFKHLHRVQDADIKEKKLTRIINKQKRICNFILQRLKLNKHYTIDSIIDRICLKYEIDIIHCPYQYIPQTRKVKLITTLHDVQELHFPEFFTPEDRAYRATNYLDFLNRADKVVVSYQHVKSDLVKYFDISPDKIHVILLEMGNLWFSKFSEKDILCSRDFDIPAKFILYPSNTWKHKNHIRLLRAIALLRDIHNIKVNLICSGHLNDHYTNEIQKVHTELQLHDQVKFIGIVDEQKLFSLYKKALGVVVPTLYEAGSFPLMESILMGIPVVCSNVTSLPETIRDQQFVFNPFDIDEMALKIRMIWESDSFRKASKENSERVGLKLLNTGALNKLKALYEE